MTIWANLLRPKRLFVTERAARAETVGEGVTNEITNRFEENHSYRMKRETNNRHTAERVENLYRMDVQIQVVNNNEIRSAADAEAISDRLAETLRDKLFAAAEGVYA